MSKNIYSLFIKNADDIENPKVRASYGTFAGIVGIILNILLSAGKIIMGVITGAVSVIADGINNLTDASSNVVSLLGFKMASRPADKEHPYGHGRYEYLSGLIVSFIIMLIGVELFKTGLDKILNPTPINVSYATFIVLGVSVLVKLFMAFFNYKTGKIINSNTLKATAVDSRNDVIATLGVIISLIIGVFTSVNLDGYVAILVALFILFSGAMLVKDTLSPLLGTAPEKEQVEKIRQKILSYPDIIGTHDLIVHDYGPGRQFASVHVEMPADLDVIKSHDTIDKMEKDFLEQDGLHLSVHYDPILTTDEFANELREYIQQEIVKINKELSIHDLRVVHRLEDKTAVFDCVVPLSVNITHEEVIKKLNEIITKKYPNVSAIISIDLDYAN